MNTIKIFITALIISLFSFENSAQVKANFSPSDTVFCVGDQVVLTNTSRNAAYYRWFVDGNQFSTQQNVNYTFNESKTYLIGLEAMSSTAMRDTIYKSITVGVIPFYNFSIQEGNGPFCLGTELSISPWSGFGGVDSLKWDFGDGNSTSIRYPRHTYAKKGKYNMAVDVYGRCGSNHYEREVEIVDDALGKPMLSISAPYQVCPEVLTNISVYSSNGIPFNQIQVFPGEGNSTQLSDFNYQYSDTGVFTIKALASNSCGVDSSTKTIYVTKEAINNYYFYASSKNVCSGSMVSFSLYLNNNSYAIVDFGDGFLDSFDRDRNVVNHAFASEGTYKVTAKVFADCGQNDTLTAEITVDDKIKPPSFFIGKFTDRVCPGEEFFIYSPYLQKGDTFKIDFGDGTSELISDSSRYFYHAYALSGLYTISAEHINVCGNKSTASASMIAGGGGNLNLRIETDPQKGEMVASCLNDTLTFNVYGDAGRSFRNVFWTFNDGDTASGNYVKTVPQNLGLFKALCTATDYCGDKHYVAKSIQITDHTMTPRALFWLQPEIDCIHKEVLFDNVSQDANKMVWDYGDGTTEEVTKAVFHQIHTYAKAQEYDVALTATNGCGSDVDRHHFNAIAGPIISISSSQSTVAQGDSVDFNFTVNEGTEFYWELPNGLVKNDKSITYTFDAIGRFKTTIWAKSVFGCWDSASVITQVGGLGMKNLGISKNEIILYPNPTTGKVFISTNCSADTPIFYEVIDNRGRVVLSGQMNETKSIDLDATALEAGLYWISLEIASERSIGRILLH